MAPTEDQILARLHSLRRVPPNQIPVDEPECPICGNIYSADPGDVQHAVRVQAENPYQACQHVFCRRCIEELFRAGYPWSMLCPICRQQWFSSHEERVLLPEDVDDVLWAELQAFMEQASAARNSAIPHQRIYDAPEVVRIFDAPEVARAPRGGSSVARNERPAENARTFSDRGRMSRSIAFLQYILSEYDLGRNSDEQVTYRIQRLEETIERLWQRLEDLRQERARDRAHAGGRHR